jgi:autoinducer 2-degrading protein
MAEMTIIVEFETFEGAEPEFTRILIDHARRSLAEEPGCIRFDIVKPIGEDGKPAPNKIIANETYRDQNAVNAHNASPRLPSVQQATKPLLKSRRLILGRSLMATLKEHGTPPDELNAANDG